MSICLLADWFGPDFWSVASQQCSKKRWIDKRVDTGEKNYGSPLLSTRDKKLQTLEKFNFLPLKEAPKKISKQLQLSPKMTSKNLNQN